MKQTEKILTSKTTKEVRYTISLRVCDSGFYGFRGGSTDDVHCDTPDGDGSEYIKLLNYAKDGDRIEVTFIRKITETKGDNQ